MRVQWLNYHANATRRLHRPALVGVIIACCATAAWIGWSQRDKISRGVDRLRYLIALRKCERFELPANYVVVSDDAIDVARLRADNHYVVERRDYVDARPQESVALFHADCLAQFGKWAPLQYMRLPSNPSYFQPSTSNPATVFLHERRTRAGVRRLVLVECVHEPGMDSDAALLTYALFDARKMAWNELGVRFGNPHDGNLVFLMAAARPPESAHPAEKAERIFAGQASVGDSSAFSIRCQYGDKYWYIDGLLVDTDFGVYVDFSTRERNAIDDAEGSPAKQVR